MTRLETLRKALKALGYKKGAEFEYREASRGRWELRHRGEYAGVYDFERGAFVD